MTTNAGAADVDRPSIGFTMQDNSTDAMKAIERLFAPEFRNRLDGIIQFKPLNMDIIRQVVDKFIFELESQLSEKRVSLALEPDAREWLAVNGCDPKMGARPMSRVIQENIKKPLADEILFGKLAAGGMVRISVENGKLAFAIVSLREQTPETA
jgi:ATP-dependent Clp protease ATP-binding subunit ClpA